MRVNNSSISCGIKELVIEKHDEADKKTLKEATECTICAMIICTLDNKKQKKFIKLLTENRFKPIAESQGYTLFVKRLTSREQTAARAAYNKKYNWY